MRIARYLCAKTGEINFEFKMVRLGGESSNTLADDLFETLEDWNTYLKVENVDFSDLSHTPSKNEINQPKAVEGKRKQLRRPQL